MATQKPDPSPRILQAHDLHQAMQQEGEKFQEYYLWLEQSMPSVFFEEVSRENLLLITHSLMGFNLQEYFSVINRKSAAIVLCLDSADADLRILRHFKSYGIKNYQAFVSKKVAPFPGISTPLRIATIDFTEASESADKMMTAEAKLNLFTVLNQQNSDIQEKRFEEMLGKMSARFLLSLPLNHLVLAFDMLFRAQIRDNCQYEVRYDEEWEEKKNASMTVVLAWRNTPKHNFLYRLARVIFRHGLSMKRVNATYTDPYSNQSILVMVLRLHGSQGQAVWDVADIPDFLREITTVKYFEHEDLIDESLVTPGVLSGNMGNLLRVMSTFIHQALVHVDSNLYSIENVIEALCRHPELTVQLCEAFKLRFDPSLHHRDQFIACRQQFFLDVAQLDSGQEINDSRRKVVLHQGMNFITQTLKTNFYRLSYTALSFRLDPKYLDDIPFDRTKKFPELPFAIFFIRGMNFFGFHIRFKDLSRGGLRTVYPEQKEQMLAERNNVFTECYNLAWTQHIKKQRYSRRWR